MPGNKWFAIARNQYRISTSWVRSRRAVLPFVALGLVGFYVVFVAPAIVSLFMNELIAFLVSQAAVPMMQIVLFMFFFIFLLSPITSALNEVNSQHMQIFLAAPVKPSDVLLGEFMGKMPLYAIVVSIIAGTFMAFLGPLGLDIIQNTMVILLFVVTSLSAFWVGTVIAAILRTKLGKTARGKDIGRALVVVLALPLIAVMYSFMGGGLMDALLDPAASGPVKVILGLLPSSWAAEVFILFASNPGNAGTVWIEAFARLGGVIAFFAATLWLGARMADRAYRIETTSFTSAIAKPDGLFYKTIRCLGGGRSFGTLLESTFKDYARRLENLSWIAYAIGVAAMVSFFFGSPSNEPEYPLVIMDFLGVVLLSGFTVGTVSRGREALFVYKKSPSGIGKFVTAKLLQSCLVSVPIAASLTAVATILIPQSTLFNISVNAVLISVRTMAEVALLLGLALVIPNFSEESKARTLAIMINLQIAFFVTMGLGLGLQVALGFASVFKQAFPEVDSFIRFVCTHLLQTMILMAAGIVLLKLGERNLTKIE